MISKCRCPFSDIYNVHWKAMDPDTKLPAISPVSLKLLVAKDLGGVNLNWFEECGSSGFTEDINISESGNSFLTDVGNPSKDIQNADVGALDLKFCTSHTIADLDSSHQLSQSLENSFVEITQVPRSKTFPYVHLDMTSNAINEMNRTSESSYVSSDTSYANHERDSVQYDSPILYVSEHNTVTSKDANGQDLCCNDGSPHFFWSPVTEREGSHTPMKFPAFQTPQSFQTHSSTPRQLTLSLGIKPDDSDLHWSPSMETPTLTSQSQKQWNCKALASENGSSPKHCAKNKFLVDVISPHNQKASTFNSNDHDPVADIRISGYPGSECSPKSKRHCKKQKMRKSYGFHKRKTRQLFHSANNTNHDNNICIEQCNSSCNLTRPDGNLPFIKQTELLCQSLEPRIDIHAPILCQNISNSLKFLFGDSSGSQNARSNILKGPFHIIFRTEDNAVHAAFHSGGQMFFCDMYIIGMNKYLPHVCTNTVVCNYSTVAGDVRQRTGFHLPEIDYVPHTESSGHARSGKSCAGRRRESSHFMCSIKSKISEALLKEAERSYALLDSLLSENDHVNTAFSNCGVSWSELRYVETVMLKDRLEPRSLSSLSDETMNGGDIEHSYLKGTKTVSETDNCCLCLGYKWNFHNQNAKVVNLYSDFCEPDSDNLNNIITPNLNLSIHSNFVPHDFQTDVSQGSSVEKITTLLPKKSEGIKQSGMSVMKNGSCAAGMSKNQSKILPSGCFQIKKNLVAKNHHIQDPVSVYFNFSTCNNVVTGMASRNYQSVLVDYPFLKYMNHRPVNTECEFESKTVPCTLACKRDVDRESSDHKHFNAANFIKTLKSNSFPSEVTNGNNVAEMDRSPRFTHLWKDEHNPIHIDDRITVESDLKPNERVHSTQCVSDFSWTQSLDKMDSILGCLPSQIYSCSKPLGFMEDIAILKDIKICADKDSHSNNAVSCRDLQSESKGVSLNAIVDADLLMMDSSFPSQLSTEYFTKEPNFCNDDAISPEDVPSQFFRLSCLSFTPSIKPFEKNSQSGTVSCSQSTIKVFKNTDLVCEKTSKDCKMLVEDLERHSSTNLNLSKNVVNNSNSYLLHMLKDNSNLKTELDQDIHILGTEGVTISSGNHDLEETQRDGDGCHQGKDDNNDYKITLSKRLFSEKDSVVFHNKELTKTDYDNSHHSNNFYLCLSQNEDDDVTKELVSVNSKTAVRNSACSSCSENILHNQDMLNSKNSEKFQESNSGKYWDEHFLMQDSVILYDKKHVSSNGKTYTNPLKRNVMHLHQQRPSCDEKCLVDSKDFIDQSRIGTVSCTDRYEENYLAVQENGISFLQNNSKELKISTCDTEFDKVNCEDICHQTDFMSFKGASRENFPVFEKAIQQSIASVTSIHDSLAFGIDRVASTDDKAETAHKTILNSSRDSKAVTKRKISKTDVEIYQNVPCLKFDTAPTKKVKFFEEALQSAKIKLGEVSRQKDNRNKNLHNAPNVEFRNRNQILDKGAVITKDRASGKNCMDGESSAVNLTNTRNAVSDYAPFLGSECVDKHSNVSYCDKAIEPLEPVDDKIKYADKYLKMTKEVQNEFIIQDKSDDEFGNVAFNHVSKKSGSIETEPEVTLIGYETQFLLLSTYCTENEDSENMSGKSKKISKGDICEKEVDCNTFLMDFKTASGNKIQISDEAMKKAKAKLTQLDFEDENTNNYDISTKSNVSHNAQMLPMALDFVTNKLDIIFDGKLSPAVASDTIPKMFQNDFAVSDLKKLSDSSFSSNENEIIKLESTFCVNEASLGNEFMPLIGTSGSNNKTAEELCVNMENYELSTAICKKRIPQLQTTSCEKELNKKCASSESVFPLPQNAACHAASQDASVEVSENKVVLPFHGYCTTVDKEVSVLEQSLKTTRKEFDDVFVKEQFCSMQEIHPPVNTIPGHSADNVDHPKSQNVTFKNQSKIPCGFQRRHSEEVKISEESFNASKTEFSKVFPDTKFRNMGETGFTIISVSGHQKNQDPKESQNGVSEKNSEIPYSEFQTVCCEDVKSSAQPLNVVERKLDVKFTNAELCNMKEKGFLQISSSEHQLNKGGSVVTKDGAPEMPLKIPFSGFRTAANEEVKISVQSLIAARKTVGDMFTNSEFCNVGDAGHLVLRQGSQVGQEHFTEMQEDARKKLETPFCVFQTAGAEDDKNSEHSSNAAQRKLDEEFSNAVFYNIGENGFPQISVPEHQASEGDSVEAENQAFEKPLGIPFLGFKTADDKEVKISLQSLRVVKKKFDDLFSNPDFCNVEETNFTQFSVPVQEVNEGDTGEMQSRASEKLLEISSGFSHLFGHGYQDSQRNPEEIQLKASNKLLEIPSSGFQTAGEKGMEVSEQSLNAANERLGDVFSNGEKSGFPEVAVPKHQGNMRGSVETLKQAFKKQLEMPISGFQTAGGEDVKISLQSLRVAKRKLDDMFSNPEFCDLEENNFLSFSAYGQQVNEGSPEEKQNRCSYNPLEIPFPVFQTAGGENVNISRQSLNAVKKRGDVFSNAGFCNVGETDSPKVSCSVHQANKGDSEEMKNIAIKKPLEIPFGFSTASGEEVKISLPSLNAVKKKLGDVLSHAEFCTVDENGFSQVSVFDDPASEEVSVAMQNRVSKEALEVPLCKFQTAVGEGAKISVHSLNVARKTMDANFKFCAVEDTGFPNISAHEHQVSKGGSKEMQMKASKKLLELPLPGFRTACGEEVKISEQSLNAAKKKLSSVFSNEKFCNIEKHGFPPICVPEQQINEQDYEEIQNTASKMLLKVPLYGFQAGDGEKVKISEQSLNVFEKQLDDMFNAEFCNMEKISSPQISLSGYQANKSVPEEVKNRSKNPLGRPFSGFQTTGGEEVNISELSLNVGKKQLEDVFNAEFCNIKETVSPRTSGPGFQAHKDDLEEMQNSAFIKPLEMPLPGFQTAGGEEVKVLVKSLNAAKKRMGDMCANVEFCKIEAVGFSQTSDDLDNKEDFKEIEKEFFKNQLEVPFSGFQTAGGDKVKISAQSLNAAKKKLGDMFNDAESSALEEIGDPWEAQSNKPHVRLEVPVSRSQTVDEDMEKPEQSLNEIKLKFKEVECLEFCPCKEISSSKETTRGSKRKSEDSVDDTCKDFSPVYEDDTFNDVKMANKALCAANMMFEGCTTKKFSNMKQTSRISCHEFKTADGHAVKLSDEVLRKAKKKLCDPFDCSELIEHKNVFQKSVSYGFQTASGGEVKISDDALKMAKLKLVGSVTNSKFCSVKHDINENLCCGFQTAVNKKDNIPKGALNSANRNLNEQHPDEGKLSCRGGPFSVFQTAGGDAVKISEISLTAAKRKLEGVQDSEFGKRDKTIYNRIPCMTLLPDNGLSEKDSAVKEKESSSSVSSVEFHVRDRSKVNISENASNTAKRKLEEVYITDKKLRKEVPCEPTDAIAERFLNKIKQCTTDNSCDLSEVKATSMKNRVSCKSFGEGAHVNKIPCATQCSSKKKMLISDSKSKSEINISEKISKAIKNIPKESIIPGKTWFLKSQKTKQLRTSLYDYVGKSLPGIYAAAEELLSLGVKESTINITSRNAEDFVFTKDDHFNVQAFTDCKKINIDDGATLVLDENFCAKKSNFYRAFLDSPGVSSDLISESWFCNHYRWIVLKLASMEMSFPKIFGGKCLLPEQVMLQMKWRYDCEIDNGMRSALKKILERDDTPSKTLVLFVSSIVESEPNLEQTEHRDSASTLSISLCDGWYEIPGQIDSAMCQLIKQGKIRTGCKLITCGAELVGSDVACSPLEVTPGLKLKIHTNSTRRARWDCKLGYFKDPRPFTVHLSSLLANGGGVSCVKIVIVRTYPITFMEKYPDGSTTLRSEKLEALASERHEKLKQSRLEDLAFRAEKNLQEKSNLWRKQLKSGKVSKPLALMTSGREIYQVIEGSNDPESIQNQLNCSQIRLLTEFRNKQLEEKMNDFSAEMKAAVSEAQQQGKFPCDRVVTPLLKIYVKEIPSLDQNQNGAMLTVWRPSEYLISLLTEGKALKMYYLSMSRGKGPELQLNSNNATRYEEIAVDEEMINSVYSPRNVISLGDIKHLSRNSQVIDVAGIVVHVTPLSNIHVSGPCQIAYIADNELNILAIKFWNGISCLGFQDILQVRQFISASNLKIDKFHCGSTPSVSASVFSVFSANPKAIHLQTALQDLKTKIQDVDLLIQKAKEHLQPRSDIPKQNWDKQSKAEYIMVKKQGTTKNLDGPHASALGFKAYNFHSPKPYPMYSPVAMSRDSLLPKRFRLAEGNNSGMKCKLVEENKLVVDSSASSSPVSSRAKARMTALERYGCLPPMNSLPVKTSPAAAKDFKSPKMNVSAQVKPSSTIMGVNSCESADCK